MQCFSCMFPSLPSRCISLPLFSELYVGDSELHTATREALRIVCQLVERDSNSIGRLGRQAEELVRSILCFFVPLFAFHRTSSAKHAGCFFLFFFTPNIYLTERYTPPRELFYPLPDPPLISGVLPLYILALSFSLACYRSTRNCEM